MNEKGTCLRVKALKGKMSSTMNCQLACGHEPKVWLLLIILFLKLLLS